MSLGLLVNNFRVNFPMKFNAPNDLLSKQQGIFDPGSIMQSSKDFFRIFIAAVLLVDNDQNPKFLFCRKKFHLMEMKCNRS